MSAPFAVCATAGTTILPLRKGQTVRDHKVADEQGHRTQIGCQAVYPGEGQVPLLGSSRVSPRVGEVDAAVGFDHDVIGPVELPGLKAVSDDGNASVRLLPGHPSDFFSYGL